MLTKQKVLYEDKIIDCILLAKFSIIQDTFEYKPKKLLWFKWKKMVPTKKIMDVCLVFIPWKHKQKDIVLVDKKLIIDNDIDFKNKANIIKSEEFENFYTIYYYENEPVIAKLLIKNFIGYDFIFSDKSFIAELYYEDKNRCFELLYKNLPNILNEEIDDKIIVNTLFTNYTESIGSDYIELQFFDNQSIKKTFKEIKFKEKTSLFVPSSRLTHFLDIYGDFFDKPISPDGSGKFCYYGLNYYDKQSTMDIFNKLKITDFDEKEKLLVWLQKAFTEHNGFYILGI